MSLAVNACVGASVDTQPKTELKPKSHGEKRAQNAKRRGRSEADDAASPTNGGTTRATAHDRMEARWRSSSFYFPGASSPRLQHAVSKVG